MLDILRNSVVGVCYQLKGDLTSRSSTTSLQYQSVPLSGIGSTRKERTRQSEEGQQSSLNCTLRVYVDEKIWSHSLRFRLPKTLQ